MLNLTETMLQKVKIRQGIPAENTQNDALIKLMLEDAMKTLMEYCHRRIFPEALEFIARALVCKAIDRDNADNVASIKRGDMQISYNTSISQEDLTETQKSILYGYRRIRIG